MKQLVVLTIDDMTNLLDNFEETFRAKGFDVHRASNVEEGLRLLALHPKIDAVICDIHMPHLDGLEFVKRARQFYPSLPIFLMTGSPQISLEMAQSVGATHLLNKSLIDVEQVVRAAKNWPNIANE